MKSTHLFALISTLSVFGCGIFGLGDCGDAERAPIPQLQPEKLTIQEGVWGQLAFWEGDFTPSVPELACRRGTVVAVQRVVLVYEPTLGSMATVSAEHVSLLSDVSTTAVDSVWSDATGFFELAVPPGDYSIFVREDGFLYTWTGAGQRSVFDPVAVASGQTIPIRIQIRYKSTS